MVDPVENGALLDNKDREILEDGCEVIDTFNQMSNLFVLVPGVNFSRHLSLILEILVVQLPIVFIAMELLYLDIVVFFICFKVLGGTPQSTSKDCKNVILHPFLCNAF